MTLGSFGEQYTRRRSLRVRQQMAVPHFGSGPSKPTQLRFIELALRLHRSEQFMIIEVSGPSLRGAPGHMPRSAREAVERDTRRPIADQLRSNRQSLLRRAARDLQHVLDSVTGPDESETRLALRDVAAAVEARLRDWPPDD